MTTLICDIETDNLIPKLTKLHCLCIGTEALDDIEIYADHQGYKPVSEGLERMRKADRLVFHNGVGFDYPALCKLYGDDVLDRTKIFDTLILSRLLNPILRGHSLGAWGERLGFEKGSFSDWSTFTEEMGVYCIQDVAVTQRLYAKLMSMTDASLDDALKLEHDFAWCISLQELHGFRLDVEAAADLAAEMRQDMGDIELELQEVFPPKTIERWSEKTGKQLKDKIEVFNPGSRKQIAERLHDLYQWKPKIFTPAGSPQIDHKVLSTLKFSEAKLLGRYFFYQKQLSQIAEGDSAWLKCVTDDGYVHGAVNTIGTATNRCSHFAPNMAQVSKKDPRMRSVWLPDEGHVLVGCDADGLELVCLASYLGIFDEGRYADIIINGDKDAKTDAHSMTAKLVGISRDAAKGVIYALIYGCSDRKLAEMLKTAGSPIKSGKVARATLNEGIVGLGKLSDIVKKKAERGFVLGIDKRRIPIRSPHSALNFLLQSCGAILMKKSMQIFHFELAANAGLVVDERTVGFHYCANVHDEVQFSCRPDLADQVGSLFAKSITLAGERLGLRCASSGSYDVGTSWLDTH